MSAGEVILAKHWLKKAYKIQTTPEETAKVIKLFKAGRLEGVCTLFHTPLYQIILSTAWESEKAIKLFKAGTYSC